MTSDNAFVGKTEAPTDTELGAALGTESKLLWDQVLADLAGSHNLTVWEWTSYSPKAGWSVRVKHRKRNIVYLSPIAGGIVRVTFIFGAKAMTAAKAAGFPKRILKVLESAVSYPEGMGFRLDLKTAADVAAVVKLAGFKLAN